MSSERSSSSSKRRHSKVNIVKQEGINDFLKSLESEIELNRGYLNRSKSNSKDKENKLVTQSMINFPSNTNTNSTINNNTSTNNIGYKSSNNTLHTKNGKSPKKSSLLTKSLNFDYNADSSSGENSLENNGFSTIKPKKRVSVISPKRTPLANLTNSSYSNISMNQSSNLSNTSILSNVSTNSSIHSTSRLSIKDLKDSSSSSSDHLNTSNSYSSNSSGKRPSSRRELAKQMEQTHLALEEMITLQGEMKLHIPKDLKKQVSKKTEEFKTDCSKVLSKIDTLLSRVVKNLNDSKEIQTTTSPLRKSISRNSKIGSSKSPMRNSQSSPTLRYSKYSPNINCK